jgi:hypothetical protein
MVKGALPSSLDQRPSFFFFLRLDWILSLRNRTPATCKDQIPLITPSLFQSVAPLGHYPNMQGPGPRLSRLEPLTPRCCALTDHHAGRDI